MAAPNRGTRSGGGCKFLVFKGNNASVVRNALKRRPWWSNICPLPTLETAPQDEAAAGSKGMQLAKLHLQRRALVTRQKQMQEGAFLEQQFQFCWKPTLAVMPGTLGSSVTQHSPDITGPTPQLVNHFSAIDELTTKTGLLRSLQEMYSQLGMETFDYTPTTFLVKSHAHRDEASSEWLAYQTRYRSLRDGKPCDERTPMKHCRRNVWIVKPSGLNCGRGIEVFDDLHKIKRHLFAVNGSQEYLVQKYLEKPLLLWGRKFDIRCWAVVNDTFDVYVYRDGYLRTSSEPFSLALTDDVGGNSMVHLTNYCMQKNSENLGRFEEGNTLSYQQLQEYLDEHYPEKGVNFREHVLPRMRDLIRDSILSTRQKLHARNKGRRCFELFGYDFMIDEDFRVYLIEVNTNPFLGYQNPWHARLVRRMIEDMTQISIDTVFTPPPGAKVAQHPDLKPDEDGNVPRVSMVDDLSNGFELIYTEDPELEPSVMHWPVVAPGDEATAMSAVGAMAHAERSAAAAAAAVIGSAQGVDSKVSGSAVADSAASAAAAGSNVVAAAAVGHADQVARLRKWVLPRGDNWFYPVGPPSEEVEAPRRRGRRRARAQPRQSAPAMPETKHRPAAREAPLGPKRVSVRRILSPLTSVPKHGGGEDEGSGGGGAGADGIWNKAPAVTVASEPFCLPLHRRMPWVMSRLCFALGVAVPSRQSTSPVARPSGRRTKSESFDSTDSNSEAVRHTPDDDAAGGSGASGPTEREAGVAFSASLAPVTEVDPMATPVTKQRMRRDLGACCKVLVKRTAQHRPAVSAAKDGALALAFLLMHCRVASDEAAAKGLSPPRGAAGPGSTFFASPIRGGSSRDVAQNGTTGAGATDMFCGVHLPGVGRFVSEPSLEGAAMALNEAASTDDIGTGSGTAAAVLPLFKKLLSDGALDNLVKALGAMNDSFLRRPSARSRIPLPPLRMLVARAAPPTLLQAVCELDAEACSQGVLPRPEGAGESHRSASTPASPKHGAASGGDAAGPSLSERLVVSPMSSRGTAGLGACTPNEAAAGSGTAAPTVSVSAPVSPKGLVAKWGVQRPLHTRASSPPRMPDGLLGPVESMLQLVAMRCLSHLSLMTKGRGVEREAYLASGALEAQLLTVRVCRGELRRVALEAIVNYSNRELKALLATIQAALPSVTTRGARAGPSMTSAVPRAIILQSLTQELTSRALRKLAHRQRAAQEKAGQDEATARRPRRREAKRPWRANMDVSRLQSKRELARTTSHPGMLESQQEGNQGITHAARRRGSSDRDDGGSGDDKPGTDDGGTLTRHRRTGSQSSRELLVDGEQRLREHSEQRRMADEVYQEWLAKKKQDFKAAMAKKREQDAALELQAQQALERKELARERMANWLKAKDAQLRTQREREMAQHMEAEREKALWLEERRARLSVTLHRIESRAKRRSTRLAKLAPSDRAHGDDDDPAQDCDNLTPPGSRARPEAPSNTNPVKPSASRRPAARPGGGARHTLSSSYDGHVPGLGERGSSGGSSGDNVRGLQRDARRVRTRPPPGDPRSTFNGAGGSSGGDGRAHTAGYGTPVHDDDRGGSGPRRSGLELPVLSPRSRKFSEMGRTAAKGKGSARHASPAASRSSSHTSKGRSTRKKGRHHHRNVSYDAAAAAYRQRRANDITSGSVLGHKSPGRHRASKSTPPKRHGPSNGGDDAPGHSARMPTPPRAKTAAASASASTSSTPPSPSAWDDAARGHTGSRTGLARPDVPPLRPPPPDHADMGARSSERSRDVHSPFRLGSGTTPPASPMPDDDGPVASGGGAWSGRRVAAPTPPPRAAQPPRTRAEHDADFGRGGGAGTYQRHSTHDVHLDAHGGMARDEGRNGTADGHHTNAEDVDTDSNDGDSRTGAHGVTRVGRSIGGSVSPYLVAASPATTPGAGSMDEDPALDVTDDRVTHSADSHSWFIQT